MVASRKPTKSGSRRADPLEARFQRILSEPTGTPIAMTKREARYYLRRLWETGDPSEPDGETVMRAFWGEWSEDDEPA